jgi:HPt (histidine-containing phosphotransfer) domain-containing protein
MVTNNAVPVIDAVQLNRRTMGDESLQIEVLSLFATEVERLLQQAESAADPAVRVDRLHALAGVARDVGAARLAQAARLAETDIADGPHDFETLRAAIAETLAFVRQSGI